MGTINSVDEMIQYVKDQAEKSCKNLIGQELAKTNLKNVLEQIKSVILSLQSTCIQSGNNIHLEGIDFGLHPDDATLIIPKNLYTALLMQGIWWIDYEEVKNKNEYVWRDGTVYKYEKGNLYVKPNKPLKYIKLDVKLKKMFPELDKDIANAMDAAFEE